VRFFWRTLYSWNENVIYEGGRESDWHLLMQRASVSVQRYSVQYKGYNLVGVTTVEGGATRVTRGMTTEYTECWPCPLFDISLNKYFPAG
jgi:hypothetical protein